MKRNLAYFLLVLIAFAVGVEEARFGHVLGQSKFVCAAVGGKFASQQSRCILRSCYWFSDCGHWASPASYLKHVNEGDHISSAIFWLGDPQRIHGNEYFWQIGKPDPDMFSLFIENDQVRQFPPDTQNLRKANELF